jgi:tetratricopeptide (TPR) repeat protein
MASLSSDETEWSVRFQAAQNALITHDFSTAADEYENAVELAERFHLGDELVAESLEGLAAARSRADEPPDIASLFNRACEIRDRLLAENEASLGPDHLEIAACLDRCAFHRLMQKKPSEAIAFHQRAFAIRKNALGELPFDVANTLTIMAGVFSMHERNKDAAAELWQRAVAILERLHDNPDTDTQNVAMSLKGNLENLAVHAFHQGDYPAAEALFQRVIEVITKSSGPDSCAQLCNVPTYAKVLARQHKYDEAENVINAATRNPHNVAACKDVLIELYRATGRDDEAESLQDGS